MQINTWDYIVKKKTTDYLPKSGYKSKSAVFADCPNSCSLGIPIPQLPEQLFSLQSKCYKTTNFTTIK